MIALGKRTPKFAVTKPLLRCSACFMLVGALAGCAQGAPREPVMRPVGARPQAEVTAVNLSHRALQQVPMTFGEPFLAGDIPKGSTIVAYADGQALPTQADIKARNPDGSVRHAIVTVELPSLGGGASMPLNLRGVPEASAPTGHALSLHDVLESGFDASVEINIAGQPWRLDARDLLQHASSRPCKPYGRECSQWLSGPLVSEWIVGGSLLDAHGKPNRHLAAYFAVRAYGPAPVGRVRVDVIVENDWAYAPDPQNITYDAQITVKGQSPYTVHQLEHYRQARWHKAFWWGKSDPVYARQDSQYLQATRAVPRYENVKISPRVVQAAMQHLQQHCGPMQRCDQTKNMSDAGSQPGIGPLPRWTSVYIVDPSHEAYDWMLANSDALGSYGIHYRDQITGQPVSVEMHPCATIFEDAEISRCPVAPHAKDSFPHCAAQCKSPLRPNEAHHPSPAYVAYLVTGDWYYLTELKFWADWVVFRQNPVYRGYRTGLIDKANPRGQAWALRTLGFAAYGLPDDDPLKAYLNKVVQNNIDWYNRNYADNPSANALHIILQGAVVYPNHGIPDTGIATWQESYFTWAVGNLKDLGFPGADKLLNWVGVFQVNLMTSPGFCWTQASAYELQVRDSKDSPLYDSLATVYAKTFPKLQGVECNSDRMTAAISKRGKYRYPRNVMVGFPRSPSGYPAVFQIGLAVAADSDIPNAKKAWEIFMDRSVKPDYADNPQYAVIPRSIDRSTPP